MAAGSFRFEGFELDPGNRRLSRDGAPVELNARYLDALVLLAGAQGRLVSKDRFLEEVWRGIPVTDEALTQCIKTLRRQLGDDAGNPRFIETVPKHGYRFLASVAVEVADGAGAGASAAPDGPGPVPLLPWQRTLVLGLAGTGGGAAAGMLGGLLYGIAGVSQPVEPGMGVLSVMLVVVAATLVVGMVGAAGVSFGIALAGLAADRAWYRSVVGGAVGGLLTGAAVKMLGLDAFALLTGHAPTGITGAAEGVVLGGAVGLAAWLAGPASAPRSLRSGSALAALTGGAAGAAITLLGGRLMAGSLDLLARSFPESRLRLDPIGGLFGEAGFGPVSQVVTGALEGALFSGGVVAAIIVARRTLANREDRASARNS
jgi:DNA-binding winged helix-turn-helix (wHTH) protein